ncbi:hypothetical protein [Streptomyces tricolor]|uniref:Thioredoxin domain-containing protein n=1 Tax=Streptomyces tricolor TaxID=68277 RepID=A0ABS9J907_9ACTN|nr:hypothetical protein [Streptomyces tricolor]MCG0062035.1 hypothetical protein [Streptomyces tricolor]
MSVLFGLVALVGLLCVRDLVLCVGAMQRLVEQAEQPARAGRDPASCLARGGRVHPFRTVTTEGVPLDREQLLDDTAVAFFLPGCTRCRERLPGFLEYARGLPGGRRQALAVVVGAEEAAAAYAARLAPVARVVVEERGGPVSRAFAVIRFPSVLRVARDTSGALVATADDPAPGHAGAPASRAA